MNVDELREKVIETILREARENGADSPVDYGDAEQLANAILALPEFEALKLVGIMKYEGDK